MLIFRHPWLLFTERFRAIRTNCVMYESWSRVSEASHKIKLDIPKFRGLENERPIKFLSEFEKYINLVQPNFDQLLCVISQALEDEAREWWYVQETEIEPFEEFVQRVKRSTGTQTLNAQRNVKLSLI